MKTDAPYMLSILALGVGTLWKKLTAWHSRELKPLQLHWIALCLWTGPSKQFFLFSDKTKCPKHTTHAYLQSRFWKRYNLGLFLLNRYKCFSKPERTRRTCGLLSRQIVQTSGVYVLLTNPLREMSLRANEMRETYKENNLSGNLHKPAFQRFALQNGRER